jgi:DNA-binding transcriptional MerR regulator
MYIGEVSKITGLSIKAIRLYEEKALILPPPRKGAYRVYNESHLEILTLIKEAKLLGTTLAQLKGVIVYKDGQVDWANLERFLAAMKIQMLQQIIDTNSKIATIDRCISAIESCPTNT